MIDLKDYVPEELKFKLPATVKFPEVIFSDCVSMDDVKILFMCLIVYEIILLLI